MSVNKTEISHGFDHKCLLLFLFDPQNKEGEKLEQIVLSSSKSNVSISDLILDREKNLWVCTAGKGLYILKTDQQKPFEQANAEITIPADFPAFTAQCTFLDRSGNLWFGSRELGIVSYNPGKQEEKEPEFTIINRANGLPREDITAIYEDREGSFWFGTNGGGVYQYRGRCLEQFGIREGLPDEVIWAIYEDKKGSFWFGSESGLTKVANIDDKTDLWQIKRYDSPQWRSRNSIIDIEEGLNGELWVAIHRTGVRIFSPLTGRFRAAADLDEKKIICIEKGNDQESRFPLLSWILPFPGEWVGKKPWKN